MHIVKLDDSAMVQIIVAIKDRLVFVDQQLMSAQERGSLKDIVYWAGVREKVKAAKLSVLIAREKHGGGNE